MFRVPFCRTQACRACTHRPSTGVRRRGLHRRATPARGGRSVAVGRRCAAAAPRSAPRPDRPVPAEAPATASPVAPADEDAMQRVTRLARQSLEEARLIVGERRITLSSGRRGRTQPDASGRALGAQSGPSGRMIAPDEWPGTRAGRAAAGMRRDAAALRPTALTRRARPATRAQPLRTRLWRP